MLFRSDRDSKLAEARELLQAALKTEDYETAAVLRDRIADLEGGAPRTGR